MIVGLDCNGKLDHFCLRLGYGDSVVSWHVAHDDARRISGDNAVRGHIACDDCSGGYDAVRSDCYLREYDGACRDDRPGADRRLAGEDGAWSHRRKRGHPGMVSYACA